MFYSIFLREIIPLRHENSKEIVMLLQVFYILFFYFVGEFVSYCMNGFIPGSVIGMILLFLALAFKKVKPQHVDRVSKLLTANMGLFFIPAGAGLMNSFGIISHYWTVIIFASVISTILVISTVALLQQKMGKE